MDQFGHKFTRKEITERIRKFWDFQKLYPFPVPKEEVLCPCCRNSDIILKHFSFFEKEASPGNYRVDVHFKCCVCSMAWAHGVPISGTNFNDADGRVHYIRLWTWREANEYHRNNSTPQPD
jgi:hypothetical protein